MIPECLNSISDAAPVFVTPATFDACRATRLRAWDKICALHIRTFLAFGKADSPLPVASLEGVANTHAVQFAVAPDWTFALRVVNAFAFMWASFQVSAVKTQHFTFPFSGRAAHFAQRTSDAFRATSLRCSGVIVFKRAFPPRRPSWTAAGFFRFAIDSYAKRLGKKMQAPHFRRCPLRESGRRQDIPVSDRRRSCPLRASFFFGSSGSHPLESGISSKSLHPTYGATLNFNLSAFNESVIYQFPYK